MTTIHLGTSSWQFDDWKGVFYPSDLPKLEQLSYYAQHFCTVEVNTSFYGLPKPSTLIHWLESVPPGFTFALKFPRAISHDKRLVDCEQESKAYLEVLRSLGEAAAPGFLQLPPDFTRARHGRALANYLDWLATQASDLRLAVEVRSADLMTPALIKFLAERGLGYVLVDRVGTPDLFATWWEATQQVAAQVRPQFAFIRWIGDDKEGPAGNDQLVAPRDEQLAQWAQQLAQLANSGLAVYGYMHNPYEGHSPASLHRLHEQLGKVIELPAWSPVSQPQPAQAQPLQMSLL